MTAKANLTQHEATPETQDNEEYYTDPVDEWLAEQSEEWSQKYQGKCLAIVDCTVVAVEDTREAAFKVFDRYPDQIPFVWYVPKEEEIKEILL
jgi:hypothetical protein